MPGPAGHSSIGRQAAGLRWALSWQVPDQNQCGGCHITDNRSRKLLPVGPKARHLNREFDYAARRENQLTHLARIGYLHRAPLPADAPRTADASNPQAPLDARARAYLDVNCGHCHSRSRTGPAITSGLWLDATTPVYISLRGSTMRVKQRNLVIGSQRALAGLVVLGASGAALAQSAGADAATTLDRITVTAQSREQELQDIPSALQVLDQKLLNDVAAENLGDIDAFVPGLVINAVQPTQPSFRLRGAETDDFGIGTDPSVGVFVDGGHGGGVLLPFVDVERIEVLKGPQARCSGATPRPARSRWSPAARSRKPGRAPRCAWAATARNTPMRCGTFPPASIRRCVSTR